MKPISFNEKMNRAVREGRKTITRRKMTLTQAGRVPKKPLYAIGERLYVRENLVQKEMFGTKFITYEDGMIWNHPPGYSYKGGYGKIPSVHMPCEAIRTILEVTDIRHEKIQDITEDDAIAEGISASDRYSDPFHKICIHCGEHESRHVGMVKACFGGYGTIYCNFSYVGGFKLVWDSIYGINSWRNNIPVWVITFKLIEK